MDYRQRLKALVRSKLLYLALSLFIVGVVVILIAGQKNTDGLQIVGQAFISCSVIAGCWAYGLTKRANNVPAAPAAQQKRSRLGLTIGLGVVCVGFMLTPVVLWPVMSTMHGILFWYIAATGLIGLLGFVGLIVWLKRSSN
jgi:hypothetical protein